MPPFSPGRLCFPSLLLRPSTPPPTFLLPRSSSASYVQFCPPPPLFWLAVAFAVQVCCSSRSLPSCTGLALPLDYSRRVLQASVSPNLNRPDLHAQIFSSSTGISKIYRRDLPLLMAFWRFCGSDLQFPPAISAFCPARSPLQQIFSALSVSGAFGFGRPHPPLADSWIHLQICQQLMVVPCASVFGFGLFGLLFFVILASCFFVFVVLVLLFVLFKGLLLTAPVFSNGLITVVVSKLLKATTVFGSLVSGIVIWNPFSVALLLALLSAACFISFFSSKFCFLLLVSSSFAFVGIGFQSTLRGPGTLVVRFLFLQ